MRGVPGAGPEGGAHASNDGARGNQSNADRQALHDRAIHDQRHQREVPETIWAPRKSVCMPLRSDLIDPDSQNITFPAQSLGELRMRMRSINKPHLSYDIDGDGFVSQEDLKIAKKIDLNKDGIIQTQEKAACRVPLAKVCAHPSPPLPSVSSFLWHSSGEPLAPPIPRPLLHIETFTFRSFLVIQHCSSWLHGRAWSCLVGLGCR